MLHITPPRKRSVLEQKKSGRMQLWPKRRLLWTWQQLPPRSGCCETCNNLQMRARVNTAIPEALRELVS